MTHIDQLINAVKDGNIKTVESLLASGVSINAKNNFGIMPIDLAGDNIDMLRLLLTQGASPNGTSFLGCTLLHSPNNNVVEVVELLLKHGASPHTTNKAGYTPLHCYTSNAESIKLLLNYGASPHAKNKEGATPLHCAVERGHASTLEILLSHGANIEEKDYNGKTPLHAAMIGKSRKVVNTLLEHGAFIQARDQDGKTPLHAAAQFLSDPSIVKILLNRGALVNLKDYKGQTPLHVAAQFSTSLPVVKTLLDRGAIVNRQDAFGNTPLSLIENTVRDEVEFPNDSLQRDKILLLLNRGAYIHKPSEYLLSTYWEPGSYLRENELFYKSLLVSGINPSRYIGKTLPDQFKSVADNIETTVKAWLSACIPELNKETVKWHEIAPKILQALPRAIYFIKRLLSAEEVSIQPGYTLETLKSMLFVPEPNYFEKIFNCNLDTTRLWILEALVTQQLPVELILDIRKHLENWAVVDYLIKDYELDAVIANYLVFDVRARLQDYIKFHQRLLQHAWKVPCPLPLFMASEAITSEAKVSL